MDAGVEVKVEDYDGSYACLFCGDSVRGQPAVACLQCNSNPWHRTCDIHLKYMEVCRTCNRKSVEAWTGASAGTAALSETVDLTGEGAGGAAEMAMLTEGATLTEGVGAREDAVGRPSAGSGSSGKGKEPAWTEAADNGSARGARAGISGENSGRGRGGGQSGHSRGSGGRGAEEDERRGEGGSKRAAPDGDKGGGSGGGKRARVGKLGQCEHNRRRSQCKECGGASICQHARRRSKCKECGGASI